MTPRLTPDDEAALSGARGPGVALAMDVLVSFARAIGAPSFLDITRAHVDGCLYHGQASLDFVERLVAGGTRVAVPTTLNVGSFDLIHPEIMRLPDAEADPARRLMRAHEALGCTPSFTCAPYQTLLRPGFGEQIAWGESNAIVFANSVIGARTNRYGDFIDLCCAVTGRAPAWGLHLDENRLATMLFRLSGFPASAEATDALVVGVGLIVGLEAGPAVPVIEGLPPPRDEDQLKALGAAAASAGEVALFHAVGITPEAPDLARATGGKAPRAMRDITPGDVAEAVARLSRVPEGTALAAVCLGTPHFSDAEWTRLLRLLRDGGGASQVPIYVNTGRETLARLEAGDAFAGLDAARIVPVTDTCTYVTAILEDLAGAVMTNSGKWAHYAPGNIGVEVAFGELEDCVLSARAGRVVRAR
ncbi:aconitase X catalytic domain-containing protein [Limibaculum sp. FT325]|uniref:aconitase X n=1 Tax=Thermohalobaculum sediminis TaxID=2939436 RepID=UPI0020BDE1DF|nr:aconitase X catalytic domain-containing protein [Limibaculum sediminis]MCL5776256.1 aconitase X catalytic domain-containing protein [Limibaculum sediminis]